MNETPEDPSNPPVDNDIREHLIARVITEDGNLFVLDPLLLSFADRGGSTQFPRRSATFWNVDLEASDFREGKHGHVHTLGDDDFFIINVVRSVEWVEREDRPTREQIGEARFLGGFRNYEERQRMDVGREERRQHDGDGEL